MDKKYFELLVCPITKGRLVYFPQSNELISKQTRLAFPIRDGIPVLLASEARTITQEEYEALP
ncbi:MAG: Trm112 family protein [Neisseriaceae bacterium]